MLNLWVALQSPQPTLHQVHVYLGRCAAACVCYASNETNLLECNELLDQSQTRRIDSLTCGPRQYPLQTAVFVADIVDMHS